MRAVSRWPSASNRQTSIAVACAENTATLTPAASGVTPSGSGAPSAHVHVGQPRQFAVQRRVAPRRVAPGHVGRHAVALQPPPRRRSRGTARRRGGSPPPASRRSTGANCTPVATPAASAIVVGVDHRVGQAADARHHRHRAVAQRAKLRQAAGLEARRHQQRIGAALDQMRQRLVIADDAADAPRMRRGGVAESRARAPRRRAPSTRKLRAARPAAPAARRAAGRCPSARSAG